MKVHEFTLILAADPNEAEADRLHSIFDDGTITTIKGSLKFIFTLRHFRWSPPLFPALLEVQKAGFEVLRVHINPSTMLGAIGNIDLRERGIDEVQAAEMRARLASFAEDWESPEMDIYDNYDEEKAKLQTR